MSEKNNQIKSETKQEKASLRERICRSLDISPDAFSNEAVVEIRGRNRVSVQGKLRIISYSPVEIRLSTLHGELDIIGKRLFCSAYSKEQITIDGYILSVGFKEEK